MKSGRLGELTRGQIALKVLLWGTTLFLALVCLRSGLTKLPGDGFWVRDFRRWGYPGWFRVAVGAAELAAFALLLVPRLAACGAALFALVMLGAIYTHAANGESSRLPFNFLLLALSVAVAFARRPAPLRRRGRAEVAAPTAARAG
jgi:putative oxidoreductase